MGAGERRIPGSSARYIRPDLLRHDFVQQVSIWTATAAEDLRAGDEAGVYMQDGFLYAVKNQKAATRNDFPVCPA